MDASIWKQIVDKVIRKTHSRELLWAGTLAGPDGTLSFSTAIDDSTTLDIWGYKTNYSYELRLTKQTPGEPFVELRRVKSKKDAEGIDYRGLFVAVRKQVDDITRERCFEAVLDYIANPPVIDCDGETVIYPDNEDERVERLRAMKSGWFHVSQVEQILTVLKDMTAAGSICWEIGTPDEEGYSLSADFGHAESDAGITLWLQSVKGRGKTLAKAAYVFEIDDATSWHVLEKINPSDPRAHKMWSLANDIHSLVAGKARNDERVFEEIVKHSIAQDILASLDQPRASSDDLSAN